MICDFGGDTPRLLAFSNQHSVLSIQPFDVAHGPEPVEG